MSDEISYLISKVKLKFEYGKYNFIPYFTGHVCDYVSILCWHKLYWPHACWWPGTDLSHSGEQYLFHAFICSTDTPIRAITVPADLQMFHHLTVRGGHSADYKARHSIIMTSYERHGVPKHRQLDCEWNPLINVSIHKGIVICGERFHDMTSPYPSD